MCATNYGAVSKNFTANETMNVADMTTSNYGQTGYPNNGFWLYGNGVAMPISGIAAGVGSYSLNSYYCDILNTAGATGIKLINQVTSSGGAVSNLIKIDINPIDPTVISPDTNLTMVITSRQW